VTLVYAFIALALVAVGLRLFVKPPQDPPEEATDDDIRRLARAGRTDDAVRWHQLLHGSDPAEARTAVDEFARDGR